MVAEFTRFFSWIICFAKVIWRRLHFYISLVLKTSKTWASKRFMAKGHTCYCGLVRGSHVEKLQYAVYIKA
jgi:hypothetical protein